MKADLSGCGRRCQVTSTLDALSGSMKKLVIKLTRGDPTPITVHFTVLQACEPGWTLDKFQLVVQGVRQIQFVVGQITTEPQSVSGLSYRLTL